MVLRLIECLSNKEYARARRPSLGRSVAHLELAVVLVAVFEGDGDHVTARVGDVGKIAAWGEETAVIDRTTRCGGDLNLDIAQVLGESHRKQVAVDGGIDGRSFRWTLDV